MKSILISIQPKWCEKIASGEKTIEVRKTKPNVAPPFKRYETQPFKCYIYCTKPKHFYKFSRCGATSDEYLNLSKKGITMGNGFDFWGNNEEFTILNGKVIGEFICNDIEDFPKDKTITEQEKEKIYKYSCLNGKEIYDYVKDKTFYVWHITKLNIYDKPKELSEYGVKCAPQSWQYVEVGE